MEKLQSQEVVMLLGDVHGDYGRLILAIEEAEENRVPIFQLGDFGYWRHTPSGAKFFAKVCRALDEHKVDLYFIRGNHELAINDGIPKSRVPPGLLDLEANVSDCFHKFDESEHLFYILDGQPWEMGGKVFMGIGGAYSIDKDYRVPYNSWWPEEEVSESLVDSTRGLKVDYVLSHETIERDFLYRDLRAKPIASSIHSRVLVGKILENVEPASLFHGHWHIFYERMEKLSSGQPLRVVGLGDNMSALKEHRIYLKIKTGEVSQKPFPF